MTYCKKLEKEKRSCWMKQKMPMNTILYRYLYRKELQLTKESTSKHNGLNPPFFSIICLEEGKNTHVFSQLFVSKKGKNPLL